METYKYTDQDVQVWMESAEKIIRQTGELIKTNLGKAANLGKKQALKKYYQFALNTSCFLGKHWIKYYLSCAISRNLCYKNNE